MADLITIEEKIAALEDVIAAREKQARRCRKFGQPMKAFHKTTPALKELAKELRAQREEER